MITTLLAPLEQCITSIFALTSFPAIIPICDKSLYKAKSPGCAELHDIRVPFDACVLAPCPIAEAEYPELINAQVNMTKTINPKAQNSNRDLTNC